MASAQFEIFKSTFPVLLYMTNTISHSFCAHVNYSSSIFTRSIPTVKENIVIFNPYFVTFGGNMSALIIGIVIFNWY